MWAAQGWLLPNLERCYYPLHRMAFRRRAKMRAFDRDWIRHTGQWDTVLARTCGPVLSDA